MKTKAPELGLTFSPWVLGRIGLRGLVGDEEVSCALRRNPLVNLSPRMKIVMNAQIAQLSHIR
jgi:hypothetical protein